LRNQETEKQESARAALSCFCRKERRLAYNILLLVVAFLGACFTESENCVKMRQFKQGGRHS
jgi:hypothetical protein